jgi:hypothetical protein
MPPKRQSKKQKESEEAFAALENEIASYTPLPNIEIQTKEGWVLPNRIKFPRFISSTFRYAAASDTMFVNQRFIKDYMQPESPYRGILVFHGLGTGKTCSSIIAAENLMTELGVVVLLPASLRSNYIGDIRTRCGNKYFQVRQKFKFVPITSMKDKLDDIVAKTFVPAKLIRKNKGVWIPVNNNNITEPNTSNFETFDEDVRLKIIEQLDAIIQTKYQFIHYNGLNNQKLDEMEKANPFNNKIVVIDEVHNFISRTIGKGKTGKRIYELLMKASNCRIIALSGTPIINNPFEVAFLLNLLAGRQNVYAIKATSNIADLSHVLEVHPRVDNFDVDVAKKMVRVQMLPEGFAFVDKTQVYIKRQANNGNTSTTNKDEIDKICSENGCKLTKVENALLFPLVEESFVNTFVDLNAHRVRNERLLAKRMMGLISYYGKYDEETYPTLLPVKMVYLNMPETMFGVYEGNRIKEIQMEKKMRNKQARFRESLQTDALANLSQVYRVFSRTACNFVFPADIKRPFPTNINAMSKELGIADDESFEEKTSSSSSSSSKSKSTAEYAKQVDAAVKKVALRADIYLTLDNMMNNLSPKFASIIKLSNDCAGKVLVYSQFRVVEGLGMLGVALEANGWSEVKLRKQAVSGAWEVLCNDTSKKKFFQYRGNNEETSILMNIFNNNLDKVPAAILMKLVGTQDGINNNLRGDILKLAMITQSGAEGISLKHVRQVHVMEPYWNEIRINQVIGRAVRANSHVELPKSERNVQVYRYIMQLPEKLAKSSKEMFMQDNGKSTDEIIHAIAMRKANIVSSIEAVMKAAAVDCMFHKKDHPSVECLKFPVNANENALAFTADLEKDETDAEYTQRVRVEKVQGKYRDCKLKGIHYAFREDTKTLYDLEAYKQGQFIQIGKLVKHADRWKIVKRQ